MGTPRAHALLSASGAKRWMACTPSARLEEQLSEKSSPYAAEGTFAHALAELKLSKAFAQMKPSVFNKKLAEMKTDPQYSQIMEDYIDSYCAIVGERFLELKKNCPDTLVMLEQRLDFSGWVPDGFGTGDVIIVSDGVLEIIDLKYGQGVPVYADNNPQMRLYALGAYNQFYLLYDFDTIRMTIIQPRLDNVSSEEIALGELLEWGDEIQAVAELAMAGEGEFVSGDHCQFCKAKATCRARAEANLELAKYDFKSPQLLTNDEIAEILEKAEELQKWAKNVQDYAYDQATNHGIKFPGWKLVEGRSNRKYTDEDAIVTKLKAEGYAEDVIFAPRKIWGITEMEKKIGKKLFEEYLDGLVVKPEGKPTLVPETDKRPEISSAASAASDFSDGLLD